MNLETFTHQNRTLYKLPLPNGITVALREPDPSVMHVAGISFFGFDEALAEPSKTQAPDFGDIPEGEGEIAKKIREAKLALMANAEGKPADPEAETARLQRLTANMARLTVWLVAGHFNADGAFEPGSVCFRNTQGRLPIRSFDEPDLVAIWNFALGFGRKEAEGDESIIEALQSFCQVLKRAGAYLPKQNRGQIARRLDGHFGKYALQVGGV